jgi:NAD/NADP transhydrogenase beta subunit
MFGRFDLSIHFIIASDADSILQAKQVVVMKRSMASGYADITNPLFHNANTRMLFGDAGKTCDLLKEKLRQIFDEKK